MTSSTLPPDPCPLCQRPNYHPSDHHLVPKCRGGRETETIYGDCHRGIHSVFTNKKLERTYNTADALLTHEEFRTMVAFIAKQDPGGKVRMRLTRTRSRHRRNG